MSYFLRVPDGNPLGGGYYDTGFQSLKRLAAGDNDELAAVDGSTVYHGWRDLTATVRDDHGFRARHARPPFSSTSRRLDARINPHDHSDHLMTAKAALDAVSDLACVRRVYYVDYHSAKLPENLNAEQRDMASSVFAVTLAGVLAYDHRTSWHHYDEVLCRPELFPRGRGRRPLRRRRKTEVAAARH